MITVLFLAANPFDNLNLNSEQELQAIREAIGSAPLASEVQIVAEKNVAFPQLPRLLRQHGPDLIHYSITALPGIGLFFAESRVPGQYLDVRDAIAGRVPTSATFTTLGSLVSSFAPRVRCQLVMSPLAADDALALLGSGGIAVGFDDFVHNDHAFALARGFYEGLGAGLGVAEAFRFGRVRFARLPAYRGQPFLVSREIDPATALIITEAISELGVASEEERPDLGRLRRAMLDSMEETDLQELCLDLAVNYEDISGRNRREKIVHLIAHFDKSGRLPQLVAWCRARRPGIRW